MTTDFSSLTDMVASDVERPKPLPMGTYDCTITEYKLDESRQNRTPFCRLTLKVISPCDDVNQEELAALGGIGEVKLSHDFWLTPKSLYRFREFFENVLGVDVQGKTFAELLPTMSGQMVKAEITHTTSKDGQDVFANVSKLIAA